MSLGLGAEGNREKEAVPFSEDWEGVNSGTSEGESHNPQLHLWTHGPGIRPYPG